MHQSSAKPRIPPKPEDKTFDKRLELVMYYGNIPKWDVGLLKTTEERLFMTIRHVFYGCRICPQTHCDAWSFASAELSRIYHRS